MITFSALFIRNIIGVLNDYNGWHRNNELLGTFFYILLFLVLVPIAYPPAHIMAIGGFVYGGIYGKVAGFFICFAIIIIVYPITSLICFMIGRRFFKKYIEENVYEKVRVIKAISRSIDASGLKILILMRMNYTMPWNALNYVMSTTNCMVSHFYISTLVGSIPYMIVYLITGVNLTRIEQFITGKAAGIQDIILFVLTIVVTCVVLYIVSKESKK